MIAELLLAGAAPGPACAVSRPAACRDTNALALATGFRPMLRRFFRGTRPASLLYAGGSLAEQAIDVLHGPPDVPVRRGGFFRFTACRAHSCTEKGALVMTPTGQPVAVAVVYGPCARSAPPLNCAEINLLNIYTRVGATTAVVADLRRWATAAVATQAIARRAPVVRVIRLD